MYMSSFVRSRVSPWISRSCITSAYPLFPDQSRKRVRFLCLVSILLLITVSAWAQLPAGWSNADIGGPGMAGSTGYTNGNWTVKGGGTDIWGSSDQFQYAYTTVNGDSTI